MSGLPATSAATAITRLAASSTVGLPLSASVLAYDDAAGLGVAEVAGVGQLPFHCTAIADGTRTIPVGTAIVCRLAAAHHGRVEAVGVVRLS